MKIFYTVRKEQDTHVVEIEPEHPINGFYGASLRLDHLSEKDAEQSIRERVDWKLNQELGQTVGSCIIEKR